MPQTSVHRHNRLRFGLFSLAVGLVLAIAPPARATTFTLQWTGAETDPQRALAVGDLDQDGDLDMVAGNSPPKFYSNNSTGTYTLYNSGGAGDNVMDADMGDFNNDGLLDYLIGNNIGSPVRVYLNIGGGGLAQAWASPETDYSTRGVVAGDFNNDGYLDAMAVTEGGPRRLYLNNGTGAMTYAWSSPEMENSLSVDAGDTDGDGDLDFVVGNYNLAPRLYRNNGNGTFTSVWTGNPGDSNLTVHLVDLDGDTDLDIAAAGLNMPSRVYRNNGNNAFTDIWNSAENINQAEMDYGDMDGDGDMDLVRTGTNANITVFLNNGAFSFTPDVVAATPSDDTQGVELGDVNGDNKLDILVANYFQNSKVYINTYAGTNTPPPPPTVAPEPDGASGSFKLEWTNGGLDDFTPNNLMSYNLRVGTAPLTGDVVSAFIPAGPGRPGGNALSWSLYLSDSGSTRTYYWSVQAVDTTGFAKSGFSTEDSFVVGGAPDSNPPPDVVFVYVDGPFQNSTTNLSASWMPGADDPETGTVGYQVELWDNAPSLVSSSLVLSPSTMVNFANLSLVPGVPYTVKVKAKDGANNLAPGVVSPPTGVENSPPTGPTFINDDGPSTTNLSMLNVVWDAANDPESGVPGFTVNVGTTPFGSDVLLDFPAPGPSGTTVPVALTAGLTYYVSVAAINGAGLTGSFVTTDGILAQTPTDVSPPTGPTFINDDGASTTNLSMLNVVWDSAMDIESGVPGFTINVGTTPFGSDVLLDFPAPGPSSATVPVALTAGLTYFVSVAAVNGAGLTGSFVTTDGILAQTPTDVSPPTGPSFINDDGLSTSNLSGLNATWDPANDVESSVFSYVFKVGLTPGGGELMTDFLQPPSPQSAFIPVGLSPGQTYYVSVAAVNGAGLTGSFVTTDGILAQAPTDVSPPTGPSFVNDDGLSTSNLSGLNVTWDPANDVESSVFSYVFKVGLTPGGSELMADFLQPPSPQSAFIPVGLSPGQTYYVSVAAVNGAGLTGSYVTTDGILAQAPADSTPPSPMIYLADEGMFTSSSTQLSISWTAAYDPESGIAEYSYSIGTAPGLGDVFPLTSVGLALTVTVSGLSLTPGLTYYVNVQAANGVGLTSMLTTDGITVDTSAPGAVANLLDEGVNKINDGALSASWDTATDAESGVNAYSVSVMAADGSTLALAQVATPFHIFTGLTLMDGQGFHVAVQAMNGAGILGPVMMTDGILMDPPAGGSDTSPPGPVTNLMDEGVQVVNNGSLSASWDAATDPESGVSAYSVSVLAPDGSAITSLSTTNPFVVFTGLPLTDGVVYIFAVQAINGASLLGPPMMTDGVLIMPPGGGGDTTPPSVVTDIQPQGPYVNTPDTLVFDWLPATDLESAVTAYSVSLMLAGAEPTLLAELGTAIPSVAFSGLGLSEGQTLYATVTAINSVGLSSDPAFGPALTIDLTPPVGAGLSYQIVSMGTSLAVQLDITPGTDNFSLTLSYDLERNTGILSDGVCFSPGPFTPLIQLPPDTLSYTDFGAAPGACYGYRLLVTDSATNTNTTDPGLLLALSTTAPPPEDITGPTGGFISYPDGEVSDSAQLIQFSPGADPSGLSSDAFIGIAAAPYDGVNCGVMAPFTEFAVIATIDQQMAPVTLLPNTCHQFSLTVYDTLGNSTTFTSPNIVKFAGGPPPILSAPITLLSSIADLGMVTPGSFSLEAFVGLTAHEALGNVRVFPSPLMLAPVSTNLTRTASVVGTTPPATGEPHIPFSMVVADPMVIPALNAGDTADLLVKVLAPAGLPTGYYEGIQTVYADLNNSFTPDENEPLASFLLRVYVPDFAGLALTCPLEELPPLDPNTGGTSP